MGSDRCPSCAASVRPGSDWCTLCYADLRPAPVPVARAPYPQAVAAPAYPPPLPVATPTDPLHAPYEHVLAAVYGGGPPATHEAHPAEAAPQAPAKPVGWPCMQCGELNGFDQSACGICLTPFGATLQSSVPVVDRKKVMTYAIGGAMVFLCLVALITFAMTKAAAGDGKDVVPTERNVPQDTLPAGPIPADVVPAETQSPDQPVVILPGQTLQPGESAVPSVLPGQPPSGLDFVPGENLLQSPAPTP